MTKYQSTQELLNAYREAANRAALNGTSIYQESREIECNEHEYIPVRWQTSNGIDRAALFCTVCGYKENNGIKKSDYPNFDALPWHDGKLRKKISEYRSQLSKWVWEQRQAAYEKNQETWFAIHSDYLRSPQWRQKRAAVLRRDGYICQACLEKQATQVHHLNYDHWGHEPLFDLVSSCKECHDRITEMDRKSRVGDRPQPDIYDDPWEVTP
jgi:5-methylcytosine-specific restriction endonuclease McrA